MADLFDIDALDEDDPFEIDSQAAHLFKYAPLGIDDVLEVWQPDPLFYPSVPPAHWLMVAQIGSDVSLCRSLRPIREKRPSVDRSGATSPRNISPAVTWRTDD